MNQNCKIWNTLHDGIITDIEGNIPGTLNLTIEIEYLANRLKGNYDSIKVSLSECTLFKYDFYKSKDETLHYEQLTEIVSQQPIIISCEEENGHLVIECACGLIQCKYTGSELFLLNNEILSYEALFNECKGYWDEWEEKYST